MPPACPAGTAPYGVTAASAYSGRMVEVTFIDELSRLRQRHTAPLILELDLSEGIAEEPPADPLSAVLAMRRPRLADVLDGLRRARTDDKVRALVVKIGGRQIGFARVQELRSAIAEFRRAGKATVAWAETYGEFGPGNAAYYLATAFKRIWLQPSGDVGLTGLSLEQMFYRGALDKLGLQYQVAKRHEYKNAADRFTEQGFTGPAREALERLAASLTGQLGDAIAERLGDPRGAGPRTDRQRPLRRRGSAGVAPGRCARLPGRGLPGRAQGRRGRCPPALPRPIPPLPGAGRAGQETARTCQGHGRAHLRVRPDPARAPRPRPADRRGHGLGHGGRGPAGRRRRPPGARDRAAGRTAPKRLHAVASDTIWREVVRARQAGTPIVVSMGDVVLASGGYYIWRWRPTRSSRSRARSPGSIGVLTGKPVTASLLERGRRSPPTR